jgi:hypothetical protein
MSFANNILCNLIDSYQKKNNHQQKSLIKTIKQTNNTGLSALCGFDIAAAAAERLGIGRRTVAIQAR